MIRTSLATLLSLACLGLLHAQDPGRPIIGGPVHEAYIYNNTGESARATIVSPRGAVSGTIPPGVYARFAFYADGRPRVLVGFSRRSGDVLTNRTIELYPNHAYDIRYDAPVLMMEQSRAVTSPDGKKRTETIKVPRITTDKGKKAAPKNIQQFGEGN